ncbi:MAG: ferrochelatase [Pseudoxanthomonas sp.]
MSTSSQAPLILLVNLGTPDAPTAPAVRRYLAEFLSDRRVVAIPPLLWQPLLRGLILPLRGPKSAEKYASIWLKEGSPLMVYTRDLAAAVQQCLPQLEVDYAMRYGTRALRARLEQARQTGRRVLLLPLYPQYSTTTTASIGDVARARYPQGTRMIESYFEDAAWAAAVADSIARWRAQHGAGEHLLFSFHGLPQRVANNGDPYPQQCERSAALIAQALNLQPTQWTLTYQSRFGRERWLEPATDKVLTELAGRGLRQVDVACPGFAVDCLETLEEVGMQFAEGFAEYGGQLRYIPCLNASTDHARVLAQCIERELHAWG